MNYPKVKEIYGEYFSYKPARITVFIKEFPLLSFGEIEIITVIK